MRTLLPFATPRVAARGPVSAFLRVFSGGPARAPPWGTMNNHNLSNLFSAIVATVSMSLAAGCGASAADSIELGGAGDYVIVAKSGVANVAPSSVIGDVALSPAAATYLTGFGLIMDSSGTYATSSQVTGRLYAADYAAPTPAELTAVVSDMQTAFTDAAGRAADVTELGAGNISGRTLEAGVYKWGTGLLINSDVTLDGSGSDVWIFQIAQNLTMGSGARVVLTGGAEPENVYWQVAGLVDLGTTAHCEGTVMSQTSITLRTGASINGRLLAQSAVSIAGSSVIEP